MEMEFAISLLVAILYCMFYNNLPNYTTVLACTSNIRPGLPHDETIERAIDIFSSSLVLQLDQFCHHPSPTVFLPIHVLINIPLLFVHYHYLITQAFQTPLAFLSICTTLYENIVIICRFLQNYLRLYKKVLSRFLIPHLPYFYPYFYKVCRNI